jgi:hypothetical protein
MTEAVTDLTAKVLVKIQEQLVSMSSEMETFRRDMTAFRAEMNTRFDGVDHQLSQLSHRIDNTNMHVVAVDARLSTEISALRGMIHQLVPKPTRRRWRS